MIGADRIAELRQLVDDLGAEIRLAGSGAQLQGSHAMGGNLLRAGERLNDADVFLAAAEKQRRAATAMDAKS